MLRVDVLIVSLPLTVELFMGESNWAELLKIPVFIAIVMAMCVLHAAVLSVGVRYGIVLSTVSI